MVLINIISMIALCDVDSQPRSYLILCRSLTSVNSWLIFESRLITQETGTNLQLVIRNLRGTVEFRTRWPGPLSKSLVRLPAHLTSESSGNTWNRV